jgi:Regulator of chromosome condensation (RCC1) repeat
MGLASGLCSYPTVSCGTASCSGTQIVTAGTCNGNGSCSVPAAQNCSGGYICSGGACQTTCSTSAGCLSDSFCYANACHTDVVNISTGADHSCAALKDGRVYCWGESTFGGLGNGSTTDTIVLNPVRAGTFNDAVAVSMGSYSSYALTSSGTIRAWGRGQSYELGNGVSMDQPNPVTVATSSATLTGVTHVVGGNSYGCATTASGIYCWGANDSHGLGVDAVTAATALAIPYASPVMGESSSPAFFGGGGFHVAVNGGTVCPWGGDNGYKEITASSACNVACYSAPSNCFSVGGTVDMLAAGGSFACVKYGPNIQCWGENDQGAIGGPTSTISVAPPGNFISGLSPTPIDMQSFGTGVCALLNDGVPTLKCWGYPFSDNASSSSPPVTFSLTFPSGVKAKSLGAGDTATACLITDEGSPWCWGANTYGNVGNGTQGNMVPNPVEVLVNW